MSPSSPSHPSPSQEVALFGRESREGEDTSTPVSRLDLTEKLTRDPVDACQSEKSHSQLIFVHFTLEETVRKLFTVVTNEVSHYGLLKRYS